MRRRANLEPPHSSGGASGRNRTCDDEGAPRCSPTKLHLRRSLSVGVLQKVRRTRLSSVGFQSADCGFPTNPAAFRAESFSNDLSLLGSFGLHSPGPQPRPSPTKHARVHGRSEWLTVRSMDGLPYGFLPTSISKDPYGISLCATSWILARNNQAVKPTSHSSRSRYECAPGSSLKEQTLGPRPRATFRDLSDPEGGRGMELSPKAAFLARSSLNDCCRRRGTSEVGRPRHCHRRRPLRLFGPISPIGDRVMGRQEEQHFTLRARISAG